MNPITLKTVYYTLFHSIITYGIISWGGAYNNYKKLLQTVQDKILKIVNKNASHVRHNPLNITQSFILESIIYHYPKLSHSYLLSHSKTRNKIILIPKRYKTVSSKSSYIAAINIFNKLPLELKNLKVSKRILKVKIKTWICKNV